MTPDAEDRWPVVSAAPTGRSAPTGRAARAGGSSPRRVRFRVAPATALVGLALAGTLALSGCASPQKAGSAALVGDGRITTADLTAQVHRSLANATARQQVGTDVPAFTRRELQQMIDSELLQIAADRLHVTVTDADVDLALNQFAEQQGGLAALQKRAAESGVAPADLRQFIEDVVRSDKIGDALTAKVAVPEATLRAAYQQNIDTYDQVRAAHILVKDQATANRLLAQVKAHPDRFAALAKQYSTDTGSKAKGGDLGYAGRGTYVAAFANAIFGAPANTYLVVHTEFGWHVVHVISRRTQTFEQVKADLRRSVLNDQAADLRGEYILKVAADVGVSVAPRFGVWNAKTGQVDAPANDVSSPQPNAPATAVPGGDLDGSTGSGSDGSGGSASPSPSP